jgi:hypothetical protein
MVATHTSSVNFLWGGTTIPVRLKTRVLDPAEGFGEFTSTLTPAGAPSTFEPMICPLLAR